MNHKVGLYSLVTFTFNMALHLFEKISHLSEKKSKFCERNHVNLGDKDVGVTSNSSLGKGSEEKKNVFFMVFCQTPLGPPLPPGMVFLRIKKFTPIFLWKLNL